MRLAERLLREPLLHFVVLGGLAFLLFAAVSDSRSAPLQGAIVIEPERVEMLAGGFEAVWRRPPTDDELRAIVDGYVREEVYYREALKLGLDRDDSVIRRRLMQKMEFLTDTGADLLEPAPGELEAFLVDNEATFRIRPSLAFEQIYFGETPDPGVITASLSALQTDPAAEPETLGVRTQLTPRLGLSLPGVVDGVFGGGFFERLAEFPVGEWAGPVESGYGAHLVRVVESRPGRLPLLEEVREAVMREWKTAKVLELREQFFARLLEGYVVEIRGPDAEPEKEGNR